MNDPLNMDSVNGFLQQVIRYIYFPYIFIFIFIFSEKNNCHNKDVQLAASPLNLFVFVCTKSDYLKQFTSILLFLCP